MLITPRGPEKLSGNGERKMAFKIGKIGYPCKDEPQLCLFNQEGEDVMFYGVRSLSSKDQCRKIWKSGKLPELDLEFYTKKGFSNIVVWGYVWRSEGMSSSSSSSILSLYSSKSYEFLEIGARTLDGELVPRAIFQSFNQDDKLRKAYEDATITYQELWGRLERFQDHFCEIHCYETAGILDEKAWIEKYLHPPSSPLEQGLCSKLEDCERFGMLEYDAGKEVPPLEDEEANERFGMLEYD